MNDLAWSPDGATLAVASARGIYLYAAGTLSEQSVLETEQSVRRIAFSPDGTTLAAASPEGNVTLWDTPSNRERLAFTANDPEREGWSVVTTLVFSPDSKWLAWGGANGLVRVLDTATGDRRYAFQTDTYIGASPVQVVAFSPDGRYLASDSGYGAWVWDLDGGQLLQRLEDKTGSLAAQAIGFGADSRVLVAANGRAIAYWDVTSGHLRRVKQLTGALGWTVALAVDLSGYAAAGPGWIQVRNVLTAEPARLLTGHIGQASVVAFSPDGTRLAAADGNNTVWEWDVATGRVLATLDRHAPASVLPLFVPGTRTLAWSSGHRVWLWPTSPPGQAPRPLLDQPERVASLAFSPDGRWLATGSTQSTRGPLFDPSGKLIIGNSTDSSVRLWDVATGSLTLSLPGHGRAVYALAFSPDGHSLATAGYDAIIRLWDVRSGQLIRALEGYATPVMRLAFSADGRRLASLADSEADCFEGCARSEPRPLRLWEVDTGRLLQAAADPALACPYGFTPGPDGRLLVTSLCSGAGLWDVETLRQVDQWNLGQALAYVTISPDGRLLIGTHDATIRVVEFSTGRILAEVDSDQAWLTGLALSSDGRLLASTGGDGTVALWQLSPDGSGP